MNLQPRWDGPTSWLLVTLTLLCAPTARAAELDSTASLPLLTNVQQVLDLGVEGARRAPHPVRLTGVVTYPFFKHAWFYVQDEKVGVLVIQTNETFQPAAGQRVEVTGRAGPGEIAAHIFDANVRAVGSAPWPEPRRPDLARLEAGADFGQWVALEGRVVDLFLHTRQLSLLIASGDHRFITNIRLDAPMEMPKHWLGALVEVRGICWTTVAPGNRPVGFRLHSPGTNSIRFLEAGGTNVFDQPPHTTKSLLTPRPRPDARVKLTGVVTLFNERARLFLQDNTGAARVQLLGPLWAGYQLQNLNPLNALDFSPRHLRPISRAHIVPLQPGDRIEVVGTPLPSAFSPVLVDAEYRLLERSSAPVPASVDLSDLHTGGYDSRLVTLRARLLDRVTRRVGSSVLDLLMLESDGKPCQATLAADHTNALPALERGSFLQLTGVCSMEAGEWKTIRSATLLLRDPNDVRVVRGPPPWATGTVGRILGVTGALSLAALGWIWLLRRRVRERTHELEQAKEELRRALAQEQELGRLKSNFVNLVSHEFRTPLGIILSATENLESYLDRLQPAERAELLADIRISTQRMSGLMQEVLLLARVDAGKLACKSAPLDLRAFLERLIEEVRAAADHACVIELTVAPEALTSRADEALLRHIFTNLLGNAAKYSPPGQPVRLQVTHDANTAVFTVRDEGIGIPEADQKQLFQTFHRGGNVGERPGTGLGLVIVKRCVDLHGGTLELRSQENAGTTVTVRLPLFAAAAPGSQLSTQIPLNTQ